jgi:CopG antitoxin of type II toxin-antitoxin system
MRKDDRIGVRVPRELKKTLIQIAKKEGRSLAQLCEILLREGASTYEEEGPKYLQRSLSRQNKEQLSD